MKVSSSAFDNCSALENVELCEGIKKIEQFAYIFGVAFQRNFCKPMQPVSKYAL